MRNQVFILSSEPKPGDTRERNAFGVLKGFGKAAADYYSRQDKDSAARSCISIGDHVRHEHKGRAAWGIVRELTTGMAGEPRARVQWVGDPGTPFPVCVEDLSPDRAGVVQGTLQSMERKREAIQS